MSGLFIKIKQKTFQGVFFLLFMLSVVSGISSTPEEEFALHFFEPEAHVRLAKSYHDSRQMLLAFMILEKARTAYFDPGQILILFDHLFHQKPLKEDSQEAVSILMQAADSATNLAIQESLLQYYLLHEKWNSAENALNRLMDLDPNCFDYCLQMDQLTSLMGKPLESSFSDHFLRKHPESIEAVLDKLNKERDLHPETCLTKAMELLKTYPDKGELKLFLADLLWKSGQTKEAQSHYLQAEKKGSKNPFILYACGLHFEKDLRQTERALTCYLKAYFQDPEYRFPVSHGPQSSQRLASLIHLLAGKDASETFEIVRKTDFLSYLFAPENPMLQLLILEWMADKNPVKYKDFFIQALSHPYPSLRWRSVEILVEESLLNQEDIETLFNSSNPVVKGLSFYIGESLHHPKTKIHIKDALKSPVQLWRYDGISSLLQNQDPDAINIIQELLSTESHPWFQTWLKQNLQMIEKTGNKKHQHN
ncbi:MAG: hypothetical protein JW774_11445 [Candidatus Aureabacteria bacterium]|nr:hypothetical protein [Candidatus Auribacterota bacterium]